MSKLISAIDVLINTMIDSKANNYNQHVVSGDNGVDYVVTVQIKDGLTPCQKLAALEAQSEWVSVDLSDESSLRFGKEFYFQLTSGRCGVGEFQDCTTYIRFRFEGESKAIEFWANKPVRYTALPSLPGDKGE